MALSVSVSVCVDFDELSLFCLGNVSSHLLRLFDISDSWVKENLTRKKFDFYWKVRNKSDRKKRIFGHFIAICDTSTDVTVFWRKNDNRNRWKLWFSTFCSVRGERMRERSFTSHKINWMSFWMPITLMRTTKAHPNSSDRITLTHDFYTANVDGTSSKIWKFTSSFFFSQLFYSSSSIFPFLLMTAAVANIKKHFPLFKLMI